MKNRTSFLRNFLALVLTFVFIATHAQNPVTPNASPEAKALLQLYYSISGKYTLTGQHNYPDTKNRNTRFVREYTGETPVIWSSDFGFSAPGDKDSYMARPDIIREAIRQHKKGSIITLCWHAVPPTADEPITFQTKGKGNPEALASVQGKMMEEQYKELLTPGTRLYKHWAAQVDTIAYFLKQLQDAHVPVLWRPYHEMNGDWFWWGGRIGESSTKEIYRQMYDRLVNYHKLNNLIWVWNIDRPSIPVRKFSNFYPGNGYLDILSLDVYGSDFNQAYYDSLTYLSKGKPVFFGEVGNPPSLETYKTQPNWASWVIWAGFVRNTSPKQFKEFYNDPRMLTLDDKAYWEISAPYRKACGLPVLPLKPKYALNFSGSWKLNEAKSSIREIANVPASLSIDQDDDLVFVKKFMAGEFGDDQITTEDFYLDGTASTTQVDNAQRTTSSVLDNNIIKRNSVTKYNWNGQTHPVKSNEEWTLSDGGKTLKIVHVSDGNNGQPVTETLIYQKQ